MQSSKEMLTGAKPGQMNLHSVKMRAEEIRRTLDQLLQTLQFAPASLQWSDILDKFAVLNVQLQHLSAQLRPLLLHYVAHPKSVNQTNAPLIPIMLASKLLPEQDEEKEEVLGLDGHGSNLDPAAVAKLTAEMNAIIDGLTLAGGPLDPRGPSRIALTASVKAAAANVGHVQAHMQQQRPAGPGAPAVVEGAELLLHAASYGAGLS